MPITSITHIDQNGEVQVAASEKSSGKLLPFRRTAWCNKATPNKEVPRLAQEPRILDRVARELECAGLVGEARAAKLVYLILTSRLLESPLCAVIKGQSSAGKNHVLKKVKALFPQG